MTQADERARLASRIHDVIDAGPEGDPGAFDELAPQVFAYQYANNAPYRSFCDARGVGPRSPADPLEIPAFPTAAFKDELVASFPLEEAVMAQLTAGSTAPDQRGRIFRDEIGRGLVFAANRVMTAHYLFPDLGAGTRCRLLILAPSPQMAPSMGMAIGMEQTRAHFGTDDSRFLLGWSGIDVRALVEALREAESTGVPVALVGATSAFVYFFRAAERKRMTFRLPAGSRLCDGGGYRGRFGELTREDYLGLAEEILGVPAEHCVNTLGMAESATNYFDDSLSRAVRGLGPTPAALASPDGRRKVPPAWTRVQAVSVEDLSPLPPGRPGLLRHFDLANLPTTLAVQSDNLGVCFGDGSFEIVGRAKVTGGRVALIPGERPAGPMGDKRVFRLLETYVNFSIDFKMGRVLSRGAERAGPMGEVEAGPMAEVERAGPMGEVEAGPPGSVPSCPIVVDDLVAGHDDPEAADRAAQALGRRVAGAEPPGGTPGEGGIDEGPRDDDSSSHSS